MKSQAKLVFFNSFVVLHLSLGMTSPVLGNINTAIWHPVSWACLGLRDLLKGRGGVVGTHFYVPTLLMTTPDSFRTEGGAGGGSSLTSWMVLGLADVYLLNLPFVGYAVGSSEPPSPPPHTHQGCPHLQLPDVGKTAAGQWPLALPPSSLWST